ncbi:MAG: SPOR domain-containing protein [Bacteroidales bacterium]|nr:SPOR domain-containing protein [Bacteroidales bacterium]
MRRFKSIIVFLAAVLLLSGCDWLRSTLGMPTSHDLAKIETEIRMRRVADSLNALIKDTLIVDSLKIRDSLPDSTSVSQINKDSIEKKITQPQQQKSVPIPVTVKSNTTSGKQATATMNNQAVKPASTVVNTTKIAPSQITARFYVIVGSFKDESNVAKMDGYLSKNGYKPIHLNFKNGYKVVASGAFANANEAYGAMRKLLELDFSPEDVWVYDTNQKLHIN